MKHLNTVLLWAALSLISVGDSGAVLQVERFNSDQARSCEEFARSGTPGEVQAQPSCCQGKKGVCGCRAGTIVCCDKSFSSCKC